MLEESRLLSREVEGTTSLANSTRQLRRDSATMIFLAMDPPPAAAGQVRNEVYGKCVFPAMTVSGAGKIGWLRACQKFSDYYKRDTITHALSSQNDQQKLLLL